MEKGGTFPLNRPLLTVFPDPFEITPVNHAFNLG